MDLVDHPGEGSPALTYRTLDIRFTGSGAEYFRIWSVNLLLLVVTLGIYWPWAKFRRIRYFMHNTLVDGDPLDFHADPKQMFKGWALVAVLFGMYNVASESSALAHLVALFALAGLWPALWRSSLRFRLGNTSWRGLRLRFTGSTAEAYGSLWPVVFLAVPVALMGVWTPEEAGAKPPTWLMVALGLSVLAVLAMLPWLFWRMKSYQHRHYALAHLQTEFRASVGSFYVLAVKQLGWMLPLPALMAGGIALAISIQPKGGLHLTGGNLAIVLAAMFALMFFLAFFLGMGPWWTARLQNLVWTKTGNSQIRFISRLRFRDMLWLSLKNGVLTVLTLGLYWPFAAVATARLRQEAVTIRTVIDLDELVAQAQENPKEAAGDAAGDFFGMDVGL